MSSSNNNNNGTPSRGKPSLFNADLFSSPASTGLSSLGGFGDDIFSGGSPFTLAPAAPHPASVTPSSSSQSTTETTSTITPPKSSDEKGEETLSTIPLDSPVLDPPPSTSSSSIITAIPGSIHGWNDPPFLSLTQTTGNTFQPSPQRSISQPVAPSTDSTASDTYHVQPLVGQRKSESPCPPQASTSEGGTSSNPYRIGGKRQTLNTMPAYNVPPMSFAQAPPTAPPTGPPTGPPSGPPIYSSAPPTMTTPPVVGGANVGRGLEERQSSVIPVQPHWFYLRSDEEYWFPFSVIDSSKLEETFIRLRADPSANCVVQTDGGRYDVHVTERQRVAVYWEEPPAEVRRCTWFYKGEEDKWYMPYLEDIAIKLETAFSTALVQGNWNCRVDLPGGEAVMIHSPTLMSHYSAHQVQPFNHEVDYRPKAVLRGFVERGKVEMGEDRKVDHLVFVVHGIGPFADIRMNTFRSLIDCVDDFREVSQLMLRTHKFGGRVMTEGRVEFLPVHWHSSLHGDDVGVDKQVRSITLPSISRLRDFTNTTLIDILFYTSPLYLQTIIDQVSSEMNRMLDIFKQRNPSFNGEVAVMGHSLGSCILFDLLYHQGEQSPVPSPPTTTTSSTPLGPTPSASNKSLVEQEIGEEGGEEKTSLMDTLTQLGLPQLHELFEKEMIDFDSLVMCSNEDLKDIGVPLGARKKLSSFIEEWNKKRQEEEDRKVKLAEEKLTQEASLLSSSSQTGAEVPSSTTSIEGVQYVKGTAGTGEPLVVYPPLNFNPSCLFALGSPIALFLTLRGVESLGPNYQLPTCSAVYNIFHPYDPVAYRLEPLIVSQAPQKPVLMSHHKGRKRFHLELYENIEKVSQSVKHHLVEGIRNMWHQLNELARAHTTAGVIKETEEMEEVSSQGSVDTESANEVHVPIGVLSGGNRVDHVLQEKTIESINEYLFALSSHLCYWRSEDTALFILKQIYKDQNPELIK